jgi:hypothetical protein
MATNQLELRVCGLQRSGNHAIIQWVLDQFAGKPVCFLNNVGHGDVDPHKYRPRYACDIGDIPPAEWRTMPKELLVVSFEDCASRMQKGATSILRSAFTPEYEARHDEWLGTSARRLDMLILRDPANFFASRLERLDRLSGIKDVPTIVAFWKELARAAIAALERDDPETVVVLYNRWFADRGYRRALTRRLGGRFSDATLGKVPSFGGGSSFDRRTCDGDLTAADLVRHWRKFLRPGTYARLGSYWKRFRGARRMAVMERWREREHDERLQSILADPELIELSTCLFGDRFAKPALAAHRYRRALAVPEGPPPAGRERSDGRRPERDERSVRLER